MINKIAAALCIMLAVTGLYAQESDTNTEENGRPVDSFSGLEAGMTKTDVEESLGLPDEYAGRNHMYYVYYAEDNQRVILNFDPVHSTLRYAYVRENLVVPWPRPFPPGRNPEPKVRQLAITVEAAQAGQAAAASSDASGAGQQLPADNETPAS
jgi:outer membrane protein assembly factor BamE (lipoprotein component of BamABCDE complex)